VLAVSPRRKVFEHGTSFDTTHQAWWRAQTAAPDRVPEPLRELIARLGQRSAQPSASATARMASRSLDLHLHARAPRALRQ